MAKKYYWLKLKEDYFSAPKIKKLRRIAGGDTYTIIYLKMMLFSVKNQGALIFEGIEDTFAEELALILDEDPDNVQVTLSFLSAQKLLESTDENTFLLPEAVESVGSEAESTQRMRRLREKRASHCDAAVTASDVKSITGDSSVRTSDTDIDIDIEKDIDIDTENKSKGAKAPRSRFVPPTVDDVKAYCLERGNRIDPERFVDFYASKGWMVGKSRMKDWKAAVRNWEGRAATQAATQATPKKPEERESSIDFAAIQQYITFGGQNQSPEPQSTDRIDPEW